MNAEHVAAEVAQLQRVIADIGARNAAGRFVVCFGALYDATVDTFEALGGTLKVRRARERERAGEADGG